jgi:diacylglycerol kinase family enzyme
MGRHLDHPLVAYGQGRRIEVVCEERLLPVQADGDVITETPLAYTVRRQAIRLMVRPEATEAGPRVQRGGCGDPPRPTNRQEA